MRTEGDQKRKFQPSKDLFEESDLIPNLHSKNQLTFSSTLNQLHLRIVLLMDRRFWNQLQKLHTSQPTPSDHEERPAQAF